MSRYWDCSYCTGLVLVGLDFKLRRMPYIAPSLPDRILSPPSHSAEETLVSSKARDHNKCLSLPTKLVLLVSSGSSPIPVAHTTPITAMNPEVQDQIVFFATSPRPPLKTYSHRLKNAQTGLLPVLRENLPPKKRVEHAVDSHVLQLNRDSQHDQPAAFYKQSMDEHHSDGETDGEEYAAGDNEEIKGRWPD